MKKGGKYLKAVSMKHKKSLLYIYFKNLKRKNFICRKTNPGNNWSGLICWIIKNCEHSLCEKTSEQKG